MHDSVFFEMQFLLLILFSLVLPVGIYGFLLRQSAISRWTVLVLALLLVVVSGIDVVILQALSEKAKATASLLDDKIFASQVSLALYLMPAMFAGLGVNLMSHVLVDHLKDAEKKFDRRRRTASMRGNDASHHGAGKYDVPVGLSESSVLVWSGVAILIIFSLDLVTGTEIRLHILYFFPVALVARYCASGQLAVWAVLLTTVLQIFTFAYQTEAIAPFLTDVLVSLAASTLIAVLARRARQSFLLVESLARTDPLTGLPNRRAFMERLETEIAKQQRYGEGFSLAVLDLDGFKMLNDTQGHGAGDQALQIVAGILRRGTRKSDSVARMGGDEFTLLMPGALGAHCDHLLERLRQSIAQGMTEAGYAVTASIGLKTFDSPPSNTLEAMQEADRAMYAAKGQGKNRVVRIAVQLHPREAVETLAIRDHPAGAKAPCA